MLVSSGKITIYHRVFILILGFLFLAATNGAIIAPFIGWKVSFVEIVLIITLGVIVYLLVKNTKYIYKITDDNYLIIKTPRKKQEFKIPLSDMEKVGQVKNIPFRFRIGLKYDFLNKILFLCGYSDSGIILKLKTNPNQIVICPRKEKEFLEKLQTFISKQS